MQDISNKRIRDSYHHGDLRRALLDAARRVVAAKGAPALSLTSLARSAGVAQSAPYRHFADREDLLAAVAVAGFEEFTATLQAAAERGDGAGALARMGRAYLEFGEANVELYRLMFASGLLPAAAADSPLRRAAEDSFRLLLEHVIGSAGTDHEMALVVWAQLHGLAMLKADGLIKEPLETLLDRLAF